MPIEETFHQLLGLDDCWRVITATYEEAQNRFVIQVEETPELWKAETKRVGLDVSCYDHVEPLGWRHLNVFNKEAVILCRLPRGRWAFEFMKNDLTSSKQSTKVKKLVFLTLLLIK